MGPKVSNASPQIDSCWRFPNIFLLSFGSCFSCWTMQRQRMCAIAAQVKQSSYPTRHLFPICIRSTYSIRVLMYSWILYPRVYALPVTCLASPWCALQSSISIQFHCQQCQWLWVYDISCGTKSISPRYECAYSTRVLVFRRFTSVLRRPCGSLMEGNLAFHSERQIMSFIKC